MAAGSHSRSPGRRREDRPLYRLVFPVLMGLALAGAAVFGYQLFERHREQTRQAHLVETADWAVNALATEIRGRRQAVAEAAASAPVREALSGDDAEARAGTASRLKSSLEGVDSVELLSATVDERDVTGYPGLDYAALDLIWTFLDNGEIPPVEVHEPPGKPAHWVVLEPVMAHDGETLLGFVRAAWPASELFAVVDQAHVSGGYLGLWQGEGNWNDRELHGLGDQAAKASPRNASVPVPGSRLRIAEASRRGFLPLGTHSDVFLWSGFIASLLVLVASAWLRRSLPRLQRQFRERHDQAAAHAVQPAAPKPAAPAPAPARPRGPSLDPHLFRAYDIRGVVGESLTPETARLIGRAIGSEAVERKVESIAVARDGRLSGPDLLKALSDGLAATGLEVVDVGAVPTPVLYFATYQLRTHSGVMVTGSHNPPDYNGFKIVLADETLAEQAIRGLRERIEEGRLKRGEGSRRTAIVRDDYIERIAGDIQLQRPLKVVVDAGNGIAGDIAPELMKAIGAEVVPLYCEVDGEFPNHHPDPSDPGNLEDLIQAVRDNQADLGLAFDGDGDRLGVVTPSGQIIYPDRIMMLFARDVLTRNPGAVILFDVKCSARLANEIVDCGGSPVMWKTGHSLIKAKLKETGALLAGEMSGHFFFTERWYGFDDGLYSACRLLEILAAEAGEPGEVLEGLPAGVSTPELKVKTEEGENFRILEDFREQASFDDARLTTIDGVRADFPDGWGLVRCSNTTPSLVLRFEGDDEAALSRIQEQFRRQLLAVKPDLELPF